MLNKLFSKSNLSILFNKLFSKSNLSTCSTNYSVNPICLFYLTSVSVILNVEETLSHVLQDFRLNMTMISERHNKALVILIGVLKCKDRIIFVNYVCPFENLNLQIDLMVIDNRLKTIHLVNMKCP